MKMGEKVIEIKNISKVYKIDNFKVNALNGINLNVKKASLLQSWDLQVQENQHL